MIGWKFTVDIFCNYVQKHLCSSYLHYIVNAIAQLWHAIPYFTSVAVHVGESIQFILVHQINLAPLCSSKACFEFFNNSCMHGRKPGHYRDSLGDMGMFNSGRKQICLKGLEQIQLSWSSAFFYFPSFLRLSSFPPICSLVMLCLLLIFFSKTPAFPLNSYMESTIRLIN